MQSKKRIMWRGVMAGAMLISLGMAANARELHVATTGADRNKGTVSRPLRTIQAAADKAQPGDTITVHAGVYRERVNPPRGGTSEDQRIVYQAATGEKVVIKGSEIVKGWTRVDGDFWTVTLPKDYFGIFNPYADMVRGDYIFTNKPVQHTGMVYLNGDPLIEAVAKDEPLDRPYWFAVVTNGTTSLWAWFKDADPNEQTVEINVRQSVFYPSKEQVNYITVRGFEMMQAAANWAPPTAEQIGLIGTHWSKGWLIESNRITHSRCVGITLGKFGDKYDNTYAMNSQGWTKGIEEAFAYGWSKDKVGHHQIRNNTISFCGQAGIVGSLGAIFSTVSGNSIHDIAVDQRFAGYETAGIKFHAAVDVVIRDNHIYRTDKGIWLDWMAQGTVVAGNLFHDNFGWCDLFAEVSHGPLAVYNNIFLSAKAVKRQTSGGAYAHNLFLGGISVEADSRRTPVFAPHSLDSRRLAAIYNGDDRYYNNLFVKVGLTAYDKLSAVWMQGNVFVKNGKPSAVETNALVFPGYDPKLKLIEKPDGWYLELAIDPAWKQAQRPLVTTELLGKALTPNQPFENPDGSTLRIASDYLGQLRDAANPSPGPFEINQTGMKTIKVWPKAGGI